MELNRGQSLRRLQGTSLRGEASRKGLAGGSPKGGGGANGASNGVQPAAKGGDGVNGHAAGNEVKLEMSKVPTTCSGSAHGGRGGAGSRGYATALPFEPLVYTFKNISYSVPLPKVGVKSRQSHGS